MNKQNLDPDEAKFGALLRESRVSPPLPPRFQKNVWRRIETSVENDVPVADGNWMDVLAGWVLRPRLAFAVAAVFVLAGVGLGWTKGMQLAQHEAHERYLAAVAPNSLR